MSDFCQNLNSQVNKAENDFENISSRLNGINGYISLNLKRARNMVNNIPKSTDWIKNLYEIVNILEETERIIEKMQEVDSIIQREDMYE